jgi:porin
MKVCTLGRQLLLFTLCARGVVFSQTDSVQAPHPFSFQASYVGDFVSNMRGGIKTGTCYLGMANITADFNTTGAGLWDGGNVFVKAANTHGGLPSSTLTGDFQVISNIQAGDHTYIQELWYRQTIGPVSVTAGLQDLNVKFASNDYSGMYLNSSFGVPSTIAANIPAPIFPLTSPGVMVTWDVSDKVALLASVYDGNPIDFCDNPYNLKWRLNADDGVIAVTEAQFTTRGENDLHGVYKIGVYHHDHLSVFDPETNSMETVYHHNYGVYGTIDQWIAGRADEAGGIALFARGSISPKEVNDNFSFAGAGINYYGIFRKDGSDAAGLAVAHACLETTAHETVFELTYQTTVTGNISLQPDVQYIIHPVGSVTVLRNSIAGTVRFGIRL